MLDHLHEWLSLIVRWIHVIVGVAWIGTSFYFNWLENRLERRFEKDDDLAGDLWAVHGGGFYHVQKYQVAPPKLPDPLHWFKFEAYSTWLSGIALLIVVYYLNASIYLIDPSVADISVATGIFIGVASIVVSWLVYDGLCRTALANHPAALGLIIVAYLTLLAWLLSEYLSGRAAYLHVGAAIGTFMVGNVAAVIIPSQKQMVDALTRGDKPDSRLGAAALLRSRHNNYLTLPVLFIMISNHYPMTYNSIWGWLILLLVSAAGVLVRHWFNIRHLETARIWWLPVAGLILMGVMIATSPMLRKANQAAPSSDVTMSAPDRLMAARTVIQNRCVSCHATKPTQAGFPAPPAGMVFESDSQIETLAQKIHQQVVVTRAMPIGNLTGMTEAERQIIDRWFNGIGKP